MFMPLANTFAILFNSFYFFTICLALTFHLDKNKITRGLYLFFFAAILGYKFGNLNLFPAPCILFLGWETLEKNNFYQKRYWIFAPLLLLAYVWGTLTTKVMFTPYEMLLQSGIALMLVLGYKILCNSIPEKNQYNLGFIFTTLSALFIYLTTNEYHASHNTFGGLLGLSLGLIICSKNELKTSTIKKLKITFIGCVVIIPLINIALRVLILNHLSLLPLEISAFMFLQMLWITIGVEKTIQLLKLK